MTTTAIRTSEQVEKRRYGTSGVLLPAQGQHAHSSTSAQFRPIFTELWNLFDQFITEIDDMPWWYTERSIAGLLGTAAYRCGHLPLEEFGWPRNGNRRRGRVDLYIQSPKCSREYWIETKQMYLSSNASGWEGLERTMADAERQLAGYSFKPNQNEVFGLVMVFVRPYYKLEKNLTHSDHRNCWIGDKVERPNPDYSSFFPVLRPPWELSCVWSNT
ncbi:MAG: hypothetical protein RBU21_25050 [FCB group bacterium]|nr:hypothetical protein [FCB group bacterium]